MGLDNAPYLEWEAFSFALIWYLRSFSTRNRIKMLQLEENRALKKIEETRKKAKQIQQLRAENDRKFQLKVKEKASHSK